MRKTWQEKLEDKLSFPKVLRLEEGFPYFGLWVYFIPRGSGMWRVENNLQWIFKFRPFFGGW